MKRSVIGMEGARLLWE